MSTARLTLGSIFETVNTAANTATGVLNGASASVGMLNSYVQKAAAEQALRHTADKKSFTLSLIREKAQELALEEVKVDQFKSKSAAHASYYDEAEAMYRQLLGVDPVKDTDTKPTLTAVA